MIPDGFNGRVLVDEPLSRWTTIGTGGNADFLVFPENVMEMAKLIKELDKSDIKWIVMGRGSNILFPDDGYRGVVIKTDRFDSFEISGNKVSAEAGVSLELLLRTAAESGLGGLEGLIGIPGSVGGAVRMNAGAYGFEIGERISSVSVFVDGEVREMEYSYGYRSSSVQEMVILNVYIEFEKMDKEEIFNRIEEFRRRRRKTQPIDKKTFGSVFKNPVKKKAWELLLEVGMPGVEIGGARFSDKHANFIENTGKAKTKDILKLIKMAKERVFSKTGILLEEEVVIVR